MKITLFFPELGTKVNVVFLLLICLGPITPAVAMELLPFIPNGLPPLRVIDDKDTFELVGMVLEDGAATNEGGRISRGSSMSESSLAPSNRTRIYFHNLSSWSRGNFGNNVRPILVMNKVSLL